MSGKLKRLITIAFLVAGCGSGSGGPPPVTASPTERPAATLPSGALSQMELAFVGSPRQSEIKAILDQALSLYGGGRVDGRCPRGRMTRGGDPQRIYQASATESTCA